MENKTDPHSGHRERLRERLIEQGPGSFSDEELLEVLLFYSVPRKDTYLLSHGLTESFSSLYNLFSASSESLRSAGLKDSSVALFALVRELFNRYESERDGRRVFKSIGEVDDFFIGRLRGLDEEHFAALFVDNAGRLKKYRDFGRGNLSHVDVDLRSVVSEALGVNATGVFFAHNHPNGLSAPSQSDVLATAGLVEHLAALGIKVFDHIIVSADGCSRMSEVKGLPFSFAL